MLTAAVARTPHPTGVKKATNADIPIPAPARAVSITDNPIFSPPVKNGFVANKAISTETLAILSGADTIAELFRAAEKVVVAAPPTIPAAVDIPVFIVVTACPAPVVVLLSSVSVYLMLYKTTLSDFHIYHKYNSAHCPFKTKNKKGFHN